MGHAIPSSQFGRGLLPFPDAWVAARPPFTPRGMCVELGRPGLPYVFRKDELASCHSRRSEP